jgi:alcohol dehydrogenase class IV
LNKAIVSLQPENFNFIIYDEVLPDAPDTCVYAVSKMARDEGADAVVAIGGGSIMDTAKIASSMIREIVDLETLPKPVTPRTPDVPLILIPTTCGTGSEETGVAVLSFSKTNLKFGIFVTGAALSIVDPGLTAGLPPALTASTGMDVIAHACEAYTTTSRKNPLSDARARTALRTAVKYLPRAVKNGADIDARTQMSLACTLAGMAFNDSMNNLAHGIAHAFGASSHLAHGIACALAEPCALESFVTVIPELVRDIGVDMGAEIPENAVPEEIGRLTGGRLRAFMREIGIPSFESLGFTREDVVGHVDRVMVESQIKRAPLTVTPELVEKILASMYDDYR